MSAPPSPPASAPPEVSEPSGSSSSGPSSSGPSSGPESVVRVRPLRRLPRRTALLIEAAVAVVVVVLAVNLLLAMRSDRDGDHPEGQPAGAGPVDTPLPPTGSAVDDFTDDGEAPGAFPGLDTRWRLAGEMAADHGVMKALGPAVADLEVPDGDRVVQTVVVSPNDGWTIAFSFADADTYWAVALGPEFSTLVQVVDGEAEILTRAPIRTPGSVEVLVTWRDDTIVIDSGGARLWVGDQGDGNDLAHMALIATGATPGGVDHVAVRSIEG